MSEMTEATWIKGKQVLRGRWCWHERSESFTVEIDKRDAFTGAATRSFMVVGKTPEWYGWKLMRDEEEAKP
jgi:hypothetical protein